MIIILNVVLLFLATVVEFGCKVLKIMQDFDVVLEGKLIPRTVRGLN